MGKLARDEINVRCCYVLLPTRPDFVAQDVHDFIGNMVVEVDGFHLEFEKLREFLHRQATQSEVVDFIKWVG